MTAVRSKRLTQERWLNAGLSVLRDHGADAIKAEPMARHLGTTKGSFYWHFKDVSDFHTGLLTLWRHAAETEIRRILDSTDNPVARLRALAQSFAAPPVDDTILHCEPAIRGWSRTHHSARQSVTEMDETRLGHLSGLLDEIGIGNPEMARIIYAAAMGMMDMTDQNGAQNTETIGTMVDLILALR